MRTLIAAGLCLVALLPLHSQTGTFAGTVASDTAGDVVGHADVQLPQLSRTTTTNVVGQFQFNDVAPGARVDGDIVLTPTVVSLETQHTTAAALSEFLVPLEPNALGTATALPAMVTTDKRRMLEEDPGLRKDS